MRGPQDLAHICVDMQDLFAADTPWHVPWMRRILPAIEEVAARFAAATTFTRFVPPRTVDEAAGHWKDYYALWPDMIGERLAPGLLDLVPSLRRLVPPAQVLDKQVYSPWWSGDLHRALQARRVSSVIVTGGETDVCVLATVLGAIDLGYHVYLPLDALFGSADPTHDAMLDIYRSRFQAQLTVTSVQEVIDLAREVGR